MKIYNRVALITGGSRGLGKNTALRLAENGADVIITFYQQKEAADAVVNEIEKQYQRKAVALQLDVGDMGTFDNFLGQVSAALASKWNTDRFDMLINNAGFAARMTIDQMTEAAFDSLFNVHFKGVYFLTQKALPVMNDNGCPYQNATDNKIHQNHRGAL
jgi:NAD(P)-dependent dehydrogenase (short-subunit alcohol dehydrogenase family)